MSLPKQKLAFNAANYSNRSPFPISLPRELSKLEDNYQFEMLGDDRVAGMETQLVAIRPRDQYRFGYHLWLERQTGMVLRSALLNEKGDIVEQLMFTNVQMKPEIDTALLTALPVPSMPAEPKEVSEVETKSGWVVSNLPVGFTQVMHNRFSRTVSSMHPTEHMVFTDGLATVSVFLEALDGVPLLEGLSQIGAMSAYGTVIEGHQVMVVGEVPSSTVQMIAASMRHSQVAIK